MHSPDRDHRPDAAAADLQADLPILFGRLTIECGRRWPELLLIVKCPGCRGREHVHTWGIGVTEPSHRAPHCFRRSSPLVPWGYRIFPAPNAANARTLDEFAELIRRLDRGHVTAAPSATAPATGVRRCRTR